jgi:hypothetical protein
MQVASTGMFECFWPDTLWVRLSRYALPSNASRVSYRIVSR